MQYFYLTILLLLSLFANGQVIITGTVSDSIGTVPFANIIINDINNKVIHYTTLKKMVHTK